ncbi:hypothetical protein NKG94_14555 [Micromonospora sp. M12]
MLALVRDDALTSRDLPVIGAWASGGAELAAYRGRRRRRELSALAKRIGSQIEMFFPSENGERLSAILGDEEQREPLLAAWRERPAAAVVSRIRELMDGLLA